jgi:hypothetical protein
MQEPTGRAMAQNGQKSPAINNRTTESGGAMKIYLLMLLISVIAVVAHLSSKTASQHKT